MNEHRRRIVLAVGVWLAGGLPSIAKANSRAPIVAFIDIEAPGARAACEKYRRALEGRFANAKFKPEVVFVPSTQNRTEQTRRQLRLTLENMRPTIILAANSLFAEFVRDFKLGLPILFFCSESPVTRGFTDSLIRPSAGMTGFTIGATSPMKRREMLFRLVPACKVLGVFDLEQGPAANARLIPDDPFKSIKKRYFYCDTVQELEAFVRGPDARGVDAWDVPYGGLSFLHADETVREFARIRLPVMYARVRHARLGGMAAYEPSLDEAFDAWASQTASLLDGVPIADIPIVQSTRYSFALNLAALRQVGINPPKSLIKIADLVIQ